MQQTPLHKKQIRNCADATSVLPADDFVKFGSSGKAWNKSSIVASMRRKPWMTQLQLKIFLHENWLPTWRSLVTYVSKQRSSIWKFYQRTKNLGIANLTDRFEKSVCRFANHRQTS